VRVEAGGRALVAGLSLGGYVAIELAQRAPALVAGLVLSGCSLEFKGALGVYLKLVSALMRRRWLAQSRAKAEERTRRMFPPALADVTEAQLPPAFIPNPSARHSRRSRAGSGSPCCASSPGRC